MGRGWTDSEDERLAEMVAAGLEYVEIALSLDRTENACKLRASGRGLKKDRSAVLENRRRGQERFEADPVKSELRRQRMMARFTPDERAALAAEARERNMAGTFGVRAHRPETKAKISAAHKGRRFSTEHRSKIAEARRRYWIRWRRERSGEADHERAMIERYRLAMKPTRVADSEEAPKPTERRWCDQCDAMRSSEQIAACTSRWCSVR